MVFGRAMVNRDENLALHGNLDYFPALGDLGWTAGLGRWGRTWAITRDGAT
jgi:hypothetical protein